MKKIGTHITFFLSSTLLFALPAHAQFTQTEIQRLLADDAVADERFGNSIAIDGDTAVIGALGDRDIGTKANGAAYIFTRSAGIWTQAAKLIAGDGDDYFGRSVAIDGDTVVIGADGEDGYIGVAYVFTRSADNWTQQAKLLASDRASSDNFGWSVAIDGDTTLIGARYDDDSGTYSNGAAYVFTRFAGTWTQQAKLLADDKDSFDNFGWSVAIDGNTALIGARNKDDSGLNKNGAAYVFSRSAGTWTQNAKLTATDKASSDYFGSSVAIDGDTAVIGADGEDDLGTLNNGAAYVFVRSAGTWIQQAKLLASDKEDKDKFGFAVALDGTTVVISAFTKDFGDIEDTGAAYVFSRLAGTWTQQAKLLANDRARYDAFGYAVAIDGDTAMVGAYFNNDSGIRDKGSAYVFDVAADPGAIDNNGHFIRALGDINGDGSQEIALLESVAGTVVAKVRDAPSRLLINTIEFNAIVAAADLEVLPDINGNGAPELAALGTDSPVAEVRDSLSGELLGTVEFDATPSPIDLEMITDRTGNGAPELATLGKGLTKVEVNDPLTQQPAGSLDFNNNYIPKDLAVWSRGDDVSVGVLDESKDPTRSDKVEIRDLATGQVVSHLWVGKPWELLQMELLADINGNGSPEAVILREHPDDQHVSVLPVDTQTGTRFRQLDLGPNFRPVRMRVLDDLNGNGSGEIAVLAVRRGCCNQKVWVADALTGKTIQQVYFGKQFIGEDMDIVPDMNGNGAPELAVLGLRDDGVLRAIIKDSMTGELLGSVGF